MSAKKNKKKPKNGFTPGTYKDFARWAWLTYRDDIGSRIGMMIQNYQTTWFESEKSK